MDVTNATPDGGHPTSDAATLRLVRLDGHGEVAVWWSCTDCGVDVELPAAHTAGFLVPCPDCAGPLHELWRWEPVSA